MTQSDGHERNGSGDTGLPLISAVRTAPGRTVFTEDGNGDGWLSTDYTVDVEP